jgi:hypothetical protein
MVTASVLVHGVNKVVKNHTGIMGAGSGLRVSLKGKDGQVSMCHTLQTTVK